MPFSRAPLLVLLVGTSLVVGCGSLPLEPEGAGGGGRDGGPVAGAPFHPVGWAQPEQHGLGAKTQELDCRTCHGDQLLGGSGQQAGPSCDSCHAEGWRTNCTYCHGGTADQTGAPPRDISGETSTARSSFAGHAAHVNGRASHVAWDCTTCHVKPTDVLSPGHMFDDTPGVSEVTFGQGLSPQGTYAAGTCSNLYCHGNGRSASGTVATTAAPMACSSCHADGSSGATAWGTMSGKHSRHLGAGLACADCHAGIVNTAGNAITDATKHVNGHPDVSITTSGFTYNAGTCTGTCHNHDHPGRTWTGADGSPHPTGWAVPAQHGLASKLQTQDCRTCHGQDLRGGTSSKSCDSCHQVGWRTNCTYCHGGTANQTGAPPRELNGQTDPTRSSFKGHTNHVIARPMHVAWDCNQCHVKPTDVLSANHLFDSTPGKSEVVLSGGRSSAGTYNNGTCSNTYCHGNGRTNGTVATSAAAMTCSSCHPGPGTTSAQAGAMSGQHRTHISQGIACYECHGSVVNAAGTIIDATKHVNGAKDTLFGTSNVTYSGGRCSGTCHGESHGNRGW